MSNQIVTTDSFGNKHYWTNGALRLIDYHNGEVCHYHALSITQFVSPQFTAWYYKNTEFPRRGIG